MVEMIIMRLLPILPIALSVFEQDILDAFSLTIFSSPFIFYFVIYPYVKKKEQERQMQILAYYDTLTALPNRTLFADRFKMSLAHSKRDENVVLAICFFDIDHFKHINDTFGHEEGDKILIEISQRFLSYTREEDTISRMGGDEFIMLLSVKNKTSCTELINRILVAIAEPYNLGKHTHNITASCGVTLYPEDQSDTDMLIRHADQAMYEAKISGKNKLVYFDADADKQGYEKTAFLKEVSQALQNDEMELYYQPKINMETAEVYGAEALIRWNHPSRGVLAPIDFLPFIEKTEVMVELGNWVLKQALLQIQVWNAMKKEWIVSINIDANHFIRDEFLTHLESVLLKTDHTLSNYLEIEILETEQFSDLPYVSKQIEICQSFGVRFSLDDFGTGYSSLLYLKELPINCIKIDQSFIRDILEDDKDRALIKGIIALAKAFNSDVIAEGVETIDQGEELLQLGCMFAQGYCIAKPMQAKSFLPWANGYTGEKAWRNVQKKRTTSLS